VSVRKGLRLPKPSLAAAGLSLLAFGFAAAVAAAQSAPAAEAKTARSVWDGVYTDQQASRGERDYGRSCAKCHGLSLEGDAASEVPALNADVFMRRWSGRTARGLFDVLARSMPADAPGTLSPQRTTELMAYLLRANNVPSGEQPLPLEPDGLAAIAIERAAGTGR
jgi:cytochrome c5